MEGVIFGGGATDGVYGGGGVVLFAGSSGEGEVFDGGGEGCGKEEGRVAGWDCEENWGD